MAGLRTRLWPDTTLRNSGRLAVNDLADRAHRIAQAAAKRVDTSYIAREWWQITKPNQPPIEVFFCPAQTHEQVLTHYYGCGVLPL